MANDSPTTPPVRPKKPRKPRTPKPKPAPAPLDETLQTPPEVEVSEVSEVEAPAPDPDTAVPDPALPDVTEPPVDPASAPAEPEPPEGEVADPVPPPEEIAEPTSEEDTEPLPEADDVPDVPPVVETLEPPTLPLTQPADPPPTRTGPVTLAQALATDGVRRVIVTVSYLFCLIGALTAFGMIDRSSPDGATALSPTVSLLAPASQCSRVWWVVLLGLGGYVGWLWLPRTVVDVRARAVAYRTSVAMGLLGLWLFLARTTWLVGSAILGVLVVFALMAALRVAARVPSRGFVARQAVQLGLAVTLGWMTVVASGSVAGALVTRHVPAYLVSAETWGILATTAMFGAGMALLRYFPGRLFIAAALAWGFFWIAYARALGQPRSYPLAVVAFICALLILIAGVAVFLWARGRVRERVS